MSAFEGELQPDEQVLHTAKISPAVFLSPILFFIVSLIILIISLELAAKYNEYQATLGAVLFCLSGMLFVFSILGAIAAAVRMLTTAFAVTNQRIIARTGFIRRRSINLPLADIQSVDVKQNIFGRLFKSGTITLTGADGTRQSFKGIVDPITAQRKIQQIIEK